MDDLSNELKKKNVLFFNLHGLKRGEEAASGSDRSEETSEPDVEDALEPFRFVLCTAAVNDCFNILAAPLIPSAWLLDWRVSREYVQSDGVGLGDLCSVRENCDPFDADTSEDGVSVSEWP